MSGHKGDIVNKIVETAIVIAEEKGWEKVRLFDIATMLNIPMSEIQQHLKGKEEIAEAWFAQADKAMLQRADVSLFTLSMPDRYYLLITAWLDKVSMHAKATRGMIKSNFDPTHLYTQLSTVLRIGRTVQWVREAAHCHQSFLQRALHEVWLTTVFISTVIYWLQDHSAHFESTKSFLRRALAQGDSAANIVNSYVKFPFKQWADDFRTKNVR